MEIADFRIESLSKYRRPVSRISRDFWRGEPRDAAGSFHGGNMEIEGAASAHDSAEQIEQ